MNTATTLDLLKNLANKSIPRYTSYPTAPEWLDSQDNSKIFSRIEKLSNGKKSLALYIHIPFCQQQCWYCGCNTIIKKKSEHADTYLIYLFREIDLLTINLKEKLIVDQIHLGGGTPNFLSEKQFDQLWKKLNDSFEVRSDGEIAVEIDPRTCSKEKLKHLRMLGFNRLSLGVQDFHFEVQKAINRVQSFQLVENLVQFAREIGYKSINFDLVYGLPLQNIENFQETLALTLSLKPDRLALYSFAYLPQMRPHMKLIKPKDLPSIDEKINLFLSARDTLTKAGYKEIAMDHFALEDDELAIAAKESRLKRNFMGYTVQNVHDSLGLGVSSISYIEDAYFQNSRDLKEYYNYLDKNILPVLKLKELSQDDLIRQWTIQELMCNLKIDKEIFSAKFFLKFDEYYREETDSLEILEKRGFLLNSPQRLQVNEDGRLIIRYISSIFDKYLNQSSKVFSTLI